ncbi:ABC transporter substrate-binding protein [Microvirga pudoricolor]|uniref:ABC transporter substrate-binding protein n=1 Tax=Microvirga pudoricolor TaxID=2778729 RepID=UPI00194F550F|nr:extracellular solute-binding protein [Microvirga pudoricolor]MBM6595323.1 extracellular solute-binding protein [Microvirga pudoricolor]
MKKFLIIGGGLLAASLMAGGAAFAKTTLTMWTFLDVNAKGGRNLALKQMISDFETANPDIKIKVEPQVWSTLAEKFVLGSNAGNAPDIGWVNSENLGFIMNSDAASNLKPLVLDGWSEHQKQDFLLNSSFTAVTDGGSVRAVPLLPSTWVLMYRKDLFDAAGLTAADVATWGGVTKAAKTLTKDTNNDGQTDVWGIGLGLSQERFSVTPAFLATVDGNGGIFDDSCKAKFNNEAGRSAVTMQVDWIEKDKVTPREALAMSSDDAIDQFAAGRYAMMIIANSRYEQLQRTAAGWDGAKLAIAPVPGVKAGKPGPALLVGWWAVQWSKSPNQKAAAKFINYMSGPQGASLWNIPGEQIPTYRSVAERPEMSDPIRQGIRATSEILASSGVLMPGKCNWGRTQADFNLATQQVVLGQAKIEDALREAEQATNDRQ